MQTEKGYYKILDFSEKIGKHYNTVDNWFKKLDEKRIHYVMRVGANNEKVYDELDLKIGLFILEKRNQKWSHEAIHHELPNQFELRPFPIDEKVDTDVIDIAALKKQIFDDIKKATEEVAAAELERVKNEYQNQVKEIQAHYEEMIKGLPKPITGEEKKQQDVTNVITKRRVESQLRQEALEKWEQKPDSERLKKLGFFSKIEDINKRDRFIEEYINEHFENRLKKEFETKS